MNAKVVLITSLLLAVSSSAMASTTISDISKAKVKPGNTFTVQATIHNSEYESATYKPLTLNLPEGFKVINQPDEGLTELCADCSVERTFKIKVEEGTASGTYKIDLEPDSSYNTGFGQEETFSIVVDGEPNLFISINTTGIVQGKDSEASLKIRNTGTDTASQISVTFSMPSTSFDPSKMYLGSLRPEETAVKNISIRTSDAISSGTHDIQITSEYRDESRKDVEKASSSVYIQENAEITVSQIQTEEAYMGSDTRVMVELENTGPGEAEKLSSKLSCKNAKVQDSKAFAGSLDSGESVPTVYQVIPNSGEVNCTVEISYTDSKEEQATQSFEISASRKRTDKIPILGVLAVLLVGGTYYWRKKQE
ncbi:hypothetical protein GKQ38_01740 [Candidatus Nanohaloarchaea archaeon]|nr:hypothetical protein GKQ38_01740 [Candidatus Nanohaloarchaea archaeon]